MERLREETAEELARFRALTGEQLDRVRWAIPTELERARGIGAEELERIRGDIAAISNSLDAATHQIALLRTPGDAPRDLGARLDDILVTMNRNTDRLADALHRDVYELEQELLRRTGR
jgi:hypothetical protein